ncbi:MAG: hypothetical protein EON89_15455 [Brevundimonas sp.]|nr:MAG: hypothetical protein EON89_15455 [Brevundimonas sp.]
MSAAKARRLLARPGAWIEAVEGGYRIRNGATPAARGAPLMDETLFRALVAEPGLRGRPAGGWSLQRRRADAVDHAGRPGVVDGVVTLMEADGRPTSRRANLAHSPIAWLARRLGPDGVPWLGRAEIAAAHRLSAEAEIALRGPSVTMHWDALPRAGGGSAARVEPGDRALSASRRVEAALAACGSARPMVEAVCLRASALQAAEQGLGLRRREGRAMLIRGLQALAAHYRIG